MWDAHDRTLDKNLHAAVARFGQQVAFRCLDIDERQTQDVCVKANVVQVPSLGFFRSGQIDQLLVGVRSPGDLIHSIDAWIHA